MMLESCIGASRQQRGLTLVEVLVALAILAIVSSVVVAGFSALSSVNRSSSEGVDYSRVVQSMTEKISTDWAVPTEWTDGTVGGYLLADYVKKESGDRCSGTWVPETWAGNTVDQVRQVTITCVATAAVGQQVYVFEVGSPEI